MDDGDRETGALAPLNCLSEALATGRNPGTEATSRPSKPHEGTPKGSRETDRSVGLAEEFGATELPQ
jgi:hypothetical protein